MIELIPSVSDAFLLDFDDYTIPYKDFALNINDARVNGTVEDLIALKQAIYFILNTERYEYLIYSWDYGVEFEDLIGKPYSYVVPELERRIEDALVQDDRINSVNGFEFERKKNKIHVTFIVNSIFGDVESEVDVNV